jgi:uncharacterized membrane protein
MSQFIQHPASSIKLSFAARKAAWMVALVVLAVVAATAVILLASNGSSDSSSAAPTSSSAAPNLRYDGGPEEGSSGTAQPTGNSLTQRPYSGGGFTERFQNNRPEEGSAGH